ncbi:hypothetical protein Csa_015572 [Cucumis sativus]|uniref:Uncharacterized protein n=1 Tax=Cucumis sativus TaxID=3659 RepID=A0A0A0K7V7_CUCSA|nr:hypothetical protein Csa_015572 [Cucumis sativus]
MAPNALFYFFSNFHQFSSSLIDPSPHFPLIANTSFVSSFLSSLSLLPIVASKSLHLFLVVALPLLPSAPPTILPTCSKTSLSTSFLAIILQQTRLADEITASDYHRPCRCYCHSLSHPRQTSSLRYQKFPQSPYRLGLLRSHKTPQDLQRLFFPYTSFFPFGPLPLSFTTFLSSSFSTFDIPPI